MSDVTTVVFDTNRIDYIQRVYDEANESQDILDTEDMRGYVKGIEFMVQQLNPPIRIKH
jgi:hypothetical protein